MEMNGQPPDLAGLRCEAFICEGFVCRGEAVADANVVHLKFSGAWHRLYFDCGIVFWRLSEIAPEPWAAEEEGWSFPHADVGVLAGVVGDRLVDYRMECIPSGAKVTFTFEKGRKIVIADEDDRSNFHII